MQYFDELFTDPEGMPTNPVRSWTFKTDAKGESFYTDDPAYFVSGSAVYKDVNGNPALPIGTIAVKEDAAPEGYLLNEEVNLVSIELEEVDGEVQARLQF